MDVGHLSPMQRVEDWLRKVEISRCESNKIFRFPTFSDINLKQLYVSNINTINTNIY